MPALTPVFSPLLAGIPGLHHGFTSKDMPKPERAALDQKTATAVQVHKDGILWLDHFEKKAHEADAVATTKSGLAVGVYSADCVPTLLACQDTTTKKVYAVAAVHGGWRSTALGIAGKALLELSRRSGGRPTRYLAAVGPCISFANFEVHDDVLKKFPGALERGLARKVGTSGGRDKFLVDLPGETLRQLTSVGVAVDVDVLGLCTVEKTAHFPSHRRRDREPMNGILSFLSFD